MECSAISKEYFGNQDTSDSKGFHVLRSALCLLTPARTATGGLLFSLSPLLIQVPAIGPCGEARPDRNMVSNMKGLPTNWDVAKKVNVKWVAALGSQTYGNAVVAGGQVYIGTNNEGLRDPKVTGDKGTLMAFRESDGEFLWQAVSDKLVSGRVNDWPYQGVCSSPLVEGDRL